MRAAEVHGAVTIVGAASAPGACTPRRSRFRRRRPAGLSAVPETAASSWSGTPSQAADLAGYVVLRGEGANGTLQPLTPAPIDATSYRDTTVRSGATYVYAVVAVDKAPPNISEPSNRQTVTVRTPSAARPARKVKRLNGPAVSNRIMKARRGTSPNATGAGGWSRATCSAGSRRAHEIDREGARAARAGRAVEDRLRRPELQGSCGRAEQAAAAPSR